MKKILCAALLLSLLLTSCTDNGTNDTNNNGGSGDMGGNESMNESDGGNDIESDGTLGDTDGDGVIEDDGNGGMDGMNGGNDGGNFTRVDKVESADDAVNFIGENVYSLCSDYLPMAVETMVLSKDDMDSITYSTGLKDISGVDDIILSESPVSSIAYSLIMLRTDGTNVGALQTALGESVNPAKWVCVTAEKVASVTLDNDIVLVMADADQVDAILDAVIKAADGIYENIGTVVNAVG